MAGTIAIASTEGEVALVAATAKTVLRLTAATNRPIKILGWGIYFDGVNAAAQPIQVRARKSTTTGTSTAVTIRKRNETLGTIQTTSGKNFSVEPTDGDILDIVEVHPTSGYEVLYPVGQEPIISGGLRFGIKATAPAGVNCEAKIIFEE